MLLLKLISLLSTIVLIHGHGRLMHPPGRGSAWRFGFKTPTNYNDEGLYCGGYSTQWNNNGKCGVCGDGWTIPTPRNHELFGRFVAKPPAIVDHYKAGQEIELKVQLTANHGGFFVFQVCPANDRTEVTEQCLQSHPLVLSSNSNISKPEMAIDGMSVLDDSNESNDWITNHVSTQNHYNRHPIEIKHYITTIKNPFNDDQYNYDLNQTDVESANMQVISGPIDSSSFGNRFNPVLNSDAELLKPFKYPIAFEKARVYVIKAQLPIGLRCKRCVLRWVYVAGNSWGVCDRTGYRGRVGCGPQEEFRNCADISIQ